MNQKYDLMKIDEICRLHVQTLFLLMSYNCALNLIILYILNKLWFHINITYRSFLRHLFILLLLLLLLFI